MLISGPDAARLRLEIDGQPLIADLDLFDVEVHSVTPSPRTVTLRGETHLVRMTIVGKANLSLAHTACLDRLVLDRQPAASQPAASQPAASQPAATRRPRPSRPRASRPRPGPDRRASLRRYGAGVPLPGAGVPLPGAGAPLPGTGVPLPGAGAPLPGAAPWPLPCGLVRAPLVRQVALLLLDLLVGGPMNRSCTKGRPRRELRTCTVVLSSRLAGRMPNHPGGRLGRTQSKT